VIVLNVPIQKIETEYGYYQYLNKCYEFSQEGCCVRNTHCSLTKLLVLRSKCSTPYVAHEGHEETWYILSGTAEATLCGVNVPLSSGSCIEIGCGDLHSLRNVGRGDLEVLEIWVPAGVMMLSEDDIVEEKKDE